MSRSGINCQTCVARQRKCDGTQPVCRHCTRDGIQCGGYFTSKRLIRESSQFKKPRPTPPASSAIAANLLASSDSPIRIYSPPSLISDLSSSEPGTPPESSDVHYRFASSGPCVVAGQPSQEPFLINDPTRLVPPAPFPQYAPMPPSTSLRVGPPKEVSRPFLPPRKDLRQSMTPGQACLFDALFSLALPEDDLGGSWLLHRRLPDSMLPGPSSNWGHSDSRITEYYNQPDPEDSHDAQGVAARLWVPLALDRKLTSNTLPFVIESYAIWIRQFLFEPIRCIPIARKYTLDEYSEGPEARWRMVTTANAVRAITGSTEYTLEDLEVLQECMHQGFPKAASSFGTDRKGDMMKALLAMSTTYELTSISLKVFPLSKIVKLMQAIALIFRRACPDPDDRPVNLPSLMSNINIGIEHYAILDIVLGAVLNRPMYFRYDTTFPPGITETIFNIENGPGLRWTNGIPDRLVITLARMNALLEDFGSGVDPRTIEELEMEIKEFKSIVIVSTDHSLSMGRLVVQESWRQAAYIYLYMGLCGADSHDARVINAHNEFIELLTKTKPGRIPDSFLILPLPILGVATRRLDDQELLKRRMLNLTECTRKGTTGNQFIRMLEFMWCLANESGRPSKWSDLRLASLYVTGV